jgi:hypothetical protein
MTSCHISPDAELALVTLGNWHFGEVTLFISTSRIILEVWKSLSNFHVHTDNRDMAKMTTWVRVLGVGIFVGIMNTQVVLPWASALYAKSPGVWEASLLPLRCSPWWLSVRCDFIHCRGRQYG